MASQPSIHNFLLLVRNLRLVDDAIEADDHKELERLIGFNRAMLLSNSYSQDQSTLLHRAAVKGSKRVTSWLVEKGVPLESVDVDKHTPLVKAINESGNQRMVLHLLKLGANPDGHPEGRSALHVAACKSTNTRIIEGLVKHGASLERRHLGKTVLMAAAEYGFTENVKMLLAVGANALAVGEGPVQGLRALELAELSHKTHTAELLRAYMHAQAALNVVTDVARGEGLDRVQQL